MGKFKQEPTKEMVAKASKLFEQMTKEGAKILGHYRTLGRYDAATIVEEPCEKTVLKFLLRFGDILSTETLVAIPRDEATKLVE